MLLILSSFVASSPVGGGAQVLSLAALEMEAVLAPTVLLGRHPGLGAPGGGPVDATLFEGVLDGIEANGIFQRLEGVITGYFADPAQVATAARVIDKVKSLRPRALVVVDPIMGDAGKGLYVREPVARAIADVLVPRAELITPNAWELSYLTGQEVSDPASARIAARSVGRPALVSSLAVGRSIGVLWTDDQEAWLATHLKAPYAPNGTGDLLTCLFAAALLGGAAPAEALETAVSDVASQVMGAAVDVTLEALS